MTRVAITGARGRMGNLILEEIKNAPDIELVAAFDIVGLGQKVMGDVLLSDAGDLKKVLQETRPDVMIDFTVASAATDNICTAAEVGVSLVVGTTGFSPEQTTRIHRAIEDGQVAAVISPNFSVGVNVFWKLVEAAAMALREYDVEVIEAHHNKKRDAPSGTAVKTVEILRESMGLDRVVHGREGLAVRTKEIGVHAVRAGDIVGDHTVLFAGPGERLEIKHQAHSRAAFASGAVRAAGWVAGVKPGIYSMADVLAGVDPSV
ncbi:MAG: 4-hydroxy-tetrahydrodipicolinate reductase [Methanosarcinales archaeon]|nr:4-hydroxy-tetrahydrodipicolinate reductase [Methanosarcinales archaeon]